MISGHWVSWDWRAAWLFLLTCVVSQMPKLRETALHYLILGILDLQCTGMLRLIMCSLCRGRT